MIPRTTRVQTQDRNVNQLQFNILKTLDDLTPNEILDGQLIPSMQNGVVVPFNYSDATTAYSNKVSLVLTAANNPTEVSHQLGRPLVGLIVVRNTANSTFWDSQSSNTIANKHAGVDKSLLINCSANCTISLYVF